MALNRFCLTLLSHKIYTAHSLLGRGMVPGDSSTKNIKDVELKVQDTVHAKDGHVENSLEKACFH
jgi:hypothetical protein